MARTKQTARYTPEQLAELESERKQFEVTCAFSFPSVHCDENLRKSVLEADFPVEIFHKKGMQKYFLEGLLQPGNRFSS